MKPRNPGDMFIVVAICPGLSTPLRLWLRSGRDDCRELIDSLLKCNWNEQSITLRTRAFGHNENMGKCRGEKPTEQAGRIHPGLYGLSPRHFSVFSQDALHPAWRPLAAVPESGSYVRLSCILSDSGNIACYFTSRCIRSLGPGLKALVQGRTADDRLRRIFHRR